MQLLHNQRGLPPYTFWTTNPIFPTWLEKPRLLASKGLRETIWGKVTIITTRAKNAVRGKMVLGCSCISFFCCQERQAVPELTSSIL